MMRFCAPLLFVVLLSLPVAGSDEGFVSAMFEAEEHARALVPELWNCRRNFADDPQMLLGLAILVDQFGPHPYYWRSNADLYRQILEIEPQNRVAMAALARHSVTRFAADLWWPLTTLDMMRQQAERDNLEEVMLPSYSELFKWFGEEGKAFVMISDFDAARSRIIRERSRELPAVRAILDQGRRTDPDNALYDYLDAKLDFRLGRDTEGLAKTREGAKKAKLDNYADQLAAARRKLLESRGTPEEQIDTIDWWKSPSGPYVNTDKLFRVAGERATAGDTKAAAGMYEMLMRIADQTAEENGRTKVGDKYRRRRRSEYLKQKAREGLAGLEATEQR